jgi:hypothetical protein
MLNYNLLNQRPYYLHLFQNTHHACATAHALNVTPIVSQERSCSDVLLEAYKHFGSIQMYRPNDARKFKNQFIAVRETIFSEPQGVKYFEGLGSHVDEEFTGYQISIGRHTASQHGIITSRQTTC